MTRHRNPAGLHLFIVAGEPSGDLLGGRLIRALREGVGDEIAISGVGGESMADAGLDSLFDITDLSVMGLFEVVPHIPRVLRRLRETCDAIEAVRPDAVVTIDSWGFTGRLHKRLIAAGSRIPRVHYVAPQVWAWKAGRIPEIAARVDRLLCLLPHEPDWFRPAGLAVDYVGHPVVEAGIAAGDGADFRRRHGISPDVPLLALLPGSRHNEVARLLPVFRDTLARLGARFADLHVVVPTVRTVETAVRTALNGFGVPAHAVLGEAERYAAFAASNAALAASGTVALELAIAGVPHAVAYKVSPFSAFLARRFLKVRYVNLVNYLADRPIVPELLQERCTPDALARVMEKFLAESEAGRAQMEAIRPVLERLGGPDGAPSRSAARIVREVALAAHP